MIARRALRFTPAAGVMQNRLPGLKRLSWIASILLMTALVLSTAYAFEMSAVIRNVATRVDVARTVTNYLSAAQYTLATEQSLQRQYRLSPEGETFVAGRVAATSLVAALTAVRALIESPSRPAIDRILAAHRTYLSETRKLFVAANRDDVQLVITIQRDRVDVVFGEIDDELDALAKAQTVNERRAIAQLHEAQGLVPNVTLALSLIGICCLGCFLIIVRTYRIRLEQSHEAELRKLERSALLDSLTGIGNHRAYRQDLLHDVSRAARHGEALTLAILDVDDFKTVNDRDGHSQGDLLLSNLATLLTSLRSEDRAYRIGGDEFALIMSHTTMDAAVRVMERLRIEAASALFGNTLSIGLATLDAAKGGAEALQAQADAAMYAVKRLGRNAIVPYDESRDGMWLLSPTKVNNLRTLIESRAVKVEFQPIWDVAQCRILAYEALSRPHPAYGFKGPQDAFDLAERIGRSHELDAVCREAALARATGLPPGALLFINVSPKSLDHGRLDEKRLAAAVVAAGLTPDRIVIEITERSIIRAEVVISVALELRKLGFRLALDDTGAGNSGLEMLSRLPLDFVKIDREIIVRGLVDKKARGVIAGIIAIASATDAYVIAEGIETAELLQFVCGGMSPSANETPRIHGLQGYLLKRPRESFLESHETDDVAALLREFTMEPGKALRG